MSVSHVGLRHLLAWSTCLALVASPALAAAKPKGKPACVVAFEQAQEKRRKGRLMAAKEQLLSCARRSCGDIVQRECTTMLDQVRIETPTVVFAVTDARGELLTDVQVKMDGRVITSRLDGRAVSVDPGTHVFSFSTPEGQSTEQQSTIFEGAASQRVAVTFPPREVLEPAPEIEAASKSETKAGTKVEAQAEPGDVNDEKRADTRVRTDDAIRPDEAALAAPPPRSESKKKRARGSAGPVEAKSGPTVLPYVFAGVGVVSLGSFFALGAMRNSAERDLRKCWPSCSEDRLDGVKRLAVAANVSLGVSGAAFATGAVLFFTGRMGSQKEKQARAKANTAYALDVESTRSGVVAKVSGSF
jgi:hypothetical protein